MNLGDVNLACAYALVDALARGGMRHVCVSPGSRSTPLALAVARHPGVTVHVHLDERSSGFVALGIGRATSGFAGVVTTSGTAAAELLPALVEASQSRIPLVALTADRPPRLRGTGANQTIDQVRLYGSYARSYLEPPAPVSVVDASTWAQAGVEAVAASVGDPPGPVHVNCPFEEPLVPTPGWRAPSIEPNGRPLPGERLDGSPTKELADVVARTRGRLGATERGAVVAGTSRSAPDVAGFAAASGWPLLADPTSNARVPPSRPGVRGALAAGQALLADAAWTTAMVPDLVVVLGGAAISRATSRFVGAAREVVVVGTEELDPTPERPDAAHVAIAPSAFFAAVAGSEARNPERDSDWSRAWFAADPAARRSLDELLDAEGAPTGLRTARDAAAAIPDGGILVIGNSMPVRELDLVMAPRTGLRVVGNRGASGIDGLVSTAIGVATVSGGPTYALIGDLTYLYDFGSLAWTAAHDPPDLTVIVVNNGRGEIFATLGQDTVPERDRLFTTPHGADLAALTRATGVPHALVEHANELTDAMAEATGLRVVEVRIDPERDRAVREGVGRAVSDAIEGLG